MTYGCRIGITKRQGPLCVHCNTLLKEDLNG